MALSSVAIPASLLLGIQLAQALPSQPEKREVNGENTNSPQTFPGIGTPNIPVPVPNYGVPSYGVPSVNVPNYGVPNYGIPSVNVPNYGIPNVNVPGFQTVPFGIPGFPSVPIIVPGSPNYPAPAPQPPSYPAPAPQPPSYPAPAPVPQPGTPYVPGFPNVPLPGTPNVPLPGTPNVPLPGKPNVPLPGTPNVTPPGTPNVPIPGTPKPPTTPGSPPTAPQPPTPPGMPPTVPGMPLPSPPTVPGMPPTSPGMPPTVPGMPPTSPGLPPTVPGMPPTSPGSPPTAPPPTSPPAAGSCNSFQGSQYQTSGGTYTIQCATDRPGGDIGPKSANTFKDCFNICDTTNGCVGFAWVGGNGPGTCYLKSAVGTAQPNANVDIAYVPGKQSTYQPPAPAGSCASIGSQSYTSTAGSQYAVLCQTDVAGGDIGSKSSDTFKGCLDICDQTSGCLGFTYLPGTCYFKGSMGQASSNPNVNSGFKNTASNGGGTGTCPPAQTVTVTATPPAGGH